MSVYLVLGIFKIQLLHKKCMEQKASRQIILILPNQHTEPLQQCVCVCVRVCVCVCENLFTIRTNIHILC